MIKNENKIEIDNYVKHDEVESQRMSIQMIKIHGAKDHLFDQVKHYNGIGCFIEYFIEQVHQFGNLDKSRTGKLRDRKKAYNHHLT